jgi:hypothetical protein
MTDKLEILARMWIECDPNRDSDSADDWVDLTVDGVFQKRRRWEWFIPRAEASLRYLIDHGLFGADD